MGTKSRMYLPMMTCYSAGAIQNSILDIDEFPMVGKIGSIQTPPIQNLHTWHYTRCQSPSFDLSKSWPRILSNRNCINPI